MQEKMDNDIKNYQGHSGPAQPTPKKEDDYIDFEEIKK
jgi:hypothetical protein